MHLDFLLDQLASPTPGGIGRYARNLAIALAEETPQDCSFSGNVAHISRNKESEGLSELSQLISITERRFSTRVYNLAWANQFGPFKLSGRIHAPSLAAPIRQASAGSYVVPTIHDTVPWSHPETLTQRGVTWHKRMAHLAWKFSPAVAVPSESVGEALNELFNFGDRIHVVPGASSLAELSVDTITWNDARVKLGIASDFVLCVGTKEPRKGLHLMRQLSQLENSYQIVHVGPQGWGGVSNPAEDPSRFLSLGFVPDELLKLLYLHARSLVLPSIAEGFGLPVVEAMSLGCPVVISSDPALLEVSGGIASVVDVSGDPFEVSQNIKEILDGMSFRSQQPTQEATNLIVQSNTYSWTSSARKVWEIHQQLG